jgi:hypothetical protein
MVRGLRMRGLGRIVLPAVLFTFGLVAAGPLPAHAVANRWPHTAVNGFSTPDGRGFFLTYADGSVLDVGDAEWQGDASNLALAGPVVGGAVTPNGRGYWLVASDGGIFTYGAARFHGSMGAAHINQPVFSMAPSKSGNGYWLVARDGGIFAFGNAPFHGSTGAIRLNQPIDGIGTSPTGRGYRMVAKDGGIFSFGDVRFYGSLPGRGFRVSDVVGAASTPTNKGYWIAEADGQVHPFGDARFLGGYAPSLCDVVTGIFSNPKAQGYRLVLQSGATLAFGNAPGGSTPTGIPHECPTPAPPPAPAPASVTFGDGLYRIGINLGPATYRTRGNASGCYWERLSGFSGTSDDIIANDFTNVRAIVTVSATDKAFHTTGCGTWTSNLSPITSSRTAAFGGGTYFVGTDIAAGTWKSSGGSGCYWERESGFSGTSDDIIANDFTNTPTIVTIKSTDRGFKATENCGTWTKIG